MRAYAATKERFNLKAAQRDMLDAAGQYENIMIFADLGCWNYVGCLLKGAGIISEENAA